MEAPTLETLAESIIDALTSNICVVDLSGKIVTVNRAWAEFSARNAGGADYVGTSYLDVCQRATGPASEEAAEFHDGLRDVLEGRADLFQLEYPCHSQTELRWFLVRVTPLVQRHGARSGAQSLDKSLGRSGERIGAAVSHMNITRRKLLELDYARLASTDPLTDLPNRRFFDEYARIELERLRRFGGAMSVLMLDLDHFKLLNDRYGHLAGDAVLKTVGASCKTALRDSDLLARIGGEEFVLLLPETDEAGAIVLAEKIRSIIEDLRIRTDAGTLRVTSSIGLTSVTSQDLSISSAVQRADEALYAAKNGGRNRVYVRARESGSDAGRSLLGAGIWRQAS